MTTTIRQRKMRNDKDQTTEEHAEALWSEESRRELAALLAENAKLPVTAPRGLMALRLSVFRDRDDDATAPVRNELACLKKMNEDGVRLVGAARDFNVSATKVSPWNRKELGDWLNNRVPEFDVIYFWKLDRFVRSFNDMTRVVSWANDHDINLVSVEDKFDLQSALGKMFVAVLAAIAEIEALNTSARVSNMWEHAKKQQEWLTGAAPFGYEAVAGEDGKRRLQHHPAESAMLRRMAELVRDGVALSEVARIVTEEFSLTNPLHTSEVKRRLRNPAITGRRVTQTKRKSARYDERSVLYIHPDTGQPVQVGPPIFTEEEFKAIGYALDERTIARPESRAKKGGQSPYLDVLICAECGKNMLELNQKRRLASGEEIVYRRLQCRGCKPQVLVDSDAVYNQLSEDVLSLMGDLPVVERRYTKGTEMRERMEELQETYTYYADGLAPGGWATGSAFTKQEAIKKRDAAAEELAKIDPASAEDHWENVPTGKTFRQHWDEGGKLALAEDLRRIGATAVLKRTRENGAAVSDLEVRIPKDYAERLPMKPDAFGLALKS